MVCRILVDTLFYNTSFYFYAFLFLQIQDVPTRWNSTFDMISRALMHRNSISIDIKDRNLEALSDVEWEKLRNLQKLLEPCKKATEKLGEPSSNLLILDVFGSFLILFIFFTDLR